MTEADTCRKFVVPLLQKAGWDNDPHSIAEQRYFTAGRIVSQGPIAQASKPDADPFDLLCHLAFNAPVLTRRQRADQLKKQQATFFTFYAPEAREILNDLLEKYAADGELQFTLPDVLKVPPISAHGNVAEIAKLFGGVDKLGAEVNQLQALLYAT